MLRHRNILLKETRLCDSSEIAGWERQIAIEAGKIDVMRKEYLDDLNEALNTKHLSAVLPGDAAINYSKNSYAEQGLAETLLKNRKKDDLADSFLQGIWYLSEYKIIDQIQK